MSNVHLRGVTTAFGLSLLCLNLLKAPHCRAAAQRENPAHPQDQDYNAETDDRDILVPRALTHYPIKAQTGRNVLSNQHLIGLLIRRFWLKHHLCNAKPLLGNQRPEPDHKNLLQAHRWPFEDCILYPPPLIFPSQHQNENAHWYRTFHLGGSLAKPLNLYRLRDQA